MATRPFASSLLLLGTLILSSPFLHADGTRSGKILITIPGTWTLTVDDNVAAYNNKEINDYSLFPYWAMPIKQGSNRTNNAQYMALPGATGSFTIVPAVPPASPTPAVAPVTLAQKTDSYTLQSGVVYNVTFIYKTFGLDDFKHVLKLACNDMTWVVFKAEAKGMDDKTFLAQANYDPTLKRCMGLAKGVTSPFQFSFNGTVTPPRAGNDKYLVYGYPNNPGASNQK